MSELSRLKRLAQALIPNFRKQRDRYYNFEDAKMMISELGMAIPAELFTKIIDNDSILDDFLNHIYQLEDEMGKKDLITEESTINPAYQPKVYVEDNKVAFTVTWGFLTKQKVVFAEYIFKMEN